MASFYGDDASKSALVNAYDTLLPTIAPKHKARLDREVGRNISALAAYRDAELILAYKFSREEFDATAIIEQAKAEGKLIAYPKMARNGAITYVLEDGSEPTEEQLAASLCFVPGLCFDAEGYRVAYGAGYMDNFLRSYEGVKVGLVRTLRISSNPLPHGDHDERVDVLVSDSAVWMCRR